MDVEDGGEEARAVGNTFTGATVPDEDLFAFIQRIQSGRMEDQRATVPNKNIDRIKKTDSA